MQAGGPEVVFEGVVRAYGGVPALGPLDARLPAGAFVALVGASGAGKSTLLRMVNRLVEPDSGRVLIGGVPVADRPAAALRRSIGYVFQSIGLMPHMSVAENIRLPARVAGADRGVPAPDVPALLAAVELPADYAGRRPQALSGGEAQRVGVARALATGARLMLLDEPFGALDPVTRDAVGRRYRALHDRLGLTSLMVTHDMAEALLLADRILVLDRGRLVGEGAPADLLAGRAGAAASALVDVARRQAEAIAALAR
ncbi:ATP-binding cassette domain-containing protein [Sphingomonas morindae]|uniref:ATP-binding cassette domain-containing protein n=1 Tax=Sphingomonas morindae TaxID=1541170 RepID=A0ABY4X9J2_9SPHN|nr:ATP-binding cassette domain-containing protein [Sphingomonas morindae]USI73386.1 ATP-binding cassette domain-containing protein [Sphingomonas morindae]